MDELQRITTGDECVHICPFKVRAYNSKRELIEGIVLKIYSETIHVSSERMKFIFRCRSHVYC